jgi:hypothetical protein
MARDNGIVSLGNEWYLYPPQFWGSRDRARTAAVEPRETGNLPVVAPLPEICPGLVPIEASACEGRREVGGGRPDSRGSRHPMTRRGLLRAGGFALATALASGFEESDRSCAFCLRYVEFGWVHVTTSSFVCAACLPDPSAGDGAAGHRAAKRLIESRARSSPSLMTFAPGMVAEDVGGQRDTG